MTAIRRHLFAKVGHFSMENPGHVSMEINNVILLQKRRLVGRQFIPIAQRAGWMLSRSDFAKLDDVLHALFWQQHQRLNMGRAALSQSGRFNRGHQREFH